MYKSLVAVLLVLFIVPLGNQRVNAGGDAFYAITGQTGDKVQSYGFHVSFHFEDDALRGAISKCEEGGKTCDPKPKIIKNGCAAAARPIRYPVVDNYKITWDVGKACKASKRWTKLLADCKAANNGERCKVYFTKCVNHCVMGCC